MQIFIENDSECIHVAHAVIKKMVIMAREVNGCVISECVISPCIIEIRKAMIALNNHHVLVRSA